MHAVCWGVCGEEWLLVLLVSYAVTGLGFEEAPTIFLGLPGLLPARLTGKQGRGFRKELVWIPGQERATRNFKWWGHDMVCILEKSTPCFSFWLL